MCLGVNAFVLLDTYPLPIIIVHKKYWRFQMEQDTSQLRAHEQLAPVMTVGNWIVSMLLLIIPFVNIILLIVWAASSSENPNRKNWAIATLIFIAISFVLGMILSVTMAGLFSSFTSGMY
jgi:hypothetical protein